MADQRSRMNRGEFVLRLACEQLKCSQIVLAIGGVSESGQVCHRTIIIKSAPPCVLSLVNGMIERGEIESHWVSVGGGGLLVTFPS